MKNRLLVGGGLVVGAAVFVAVVTFSLTGNKQPARALAQTTGEITRTYSAGECDKGFCWTCDSAVSLDSVNIVIDNPPSRVDGVKLANGCTGVIGSLNVSTTSSDAVKATQGAHDLAVNSGNIQCSAKFPTLHQDGIQVMGGSDLTFNNMTINCGRANDTLIDSNFFVNLAGGSTVAPDHVVCDHCTLGGWAAHTVNLQDSSDSGIKNSTLCPSKFGSRLTFTKGSGAINPIDENNQFPDETDAVCQF